MDGRRTLADLQAALAGEFAPEGVRDVVATLRSLGALRAGGVAAMAAGPAAAAERTAGEPARATEDPVGAWERTPSPVVRPALDGGGEPRRLRVGILGGGTAGYLAALALRARRPEVAVTLIESSAVPVIGVGEATTPLLPQFLHADLGLDAGDLFRAVAPTLKLGIRFRWGRPAGEGAETFNYPFGPLRLLEPAAWDGDVEAASLRSLLMSAGRVPAWGGGPEGGVELGFGTAVAYHLDNRRFVAWLRERAAAAGVEPVDATIAEVVRAADGRRVDELVADDGRRFRCDLWLDCSGFRSLLLGDALGSPFVPFADSLFTDRALVAATPLDAERPAAALHLRRHLGRRLVLVDPAARRAPPRLRLRLAVPRRRRGGRGDGAPPARLRRAAPPPLRQRPPPPLRARQRGGAGQRLRLRRAAGVDRAAPAGAPDRPAGARPALAAGGGGRPPRPAQRQGRRLVGLPGLVPRPPLPLQPPPRLALLARLPRRADVSAWGGLLETFRQRGPLSADPSVSGAAGLFDPPDPLWGAAGIDLLLLAQGVACALPVPAAGEAAYRAWQQAARARVAGALPQREVLRRLAEDPALVAAFAEPFRAAGPAFGRAPDGALQAGSGALPAASSRT